MKNTLFAKNFLVFSVLLILCLASLGIYTHQANREIENADVWVAHTQKVIIETQEMMLTVSQMLSNQRDYLLTRDPESISLYEQAKTRANAQVNTLKLLSRDNKTQYDRIAGMEENIAAFARVLDRSIEKWPPVPGGVFLEDKAEINNLRSMLIAESQKLLKEEYQLLNLRAMALQDKTGDYRDTLMIGGIGSALLLLLLNGFLLRAQSGRNYAEKSLRETEDRLALAIRGSNDGVFDWDLVTDKLYWSPQYKALLGYADHELPASISVFKSLLHPDDSASFWQIYDQYITRNLSEFSHVFRMQHKSGRWIWTHARGKGLFNEAGKAIRFIGTHTDITHIKDYERRLEEEKDRAEKASAAKSEFLAHMSHEIRTPLTAISGIAEILSAMADDFNEKQRKLIQTLYSSATSLKDLIADILDFSRIESGEIELNEKQFSLSSLFEQVINITSVKAAEKQLVYSFLYDSLSDKNFYGDQARLRQILINLIGNAIKFTDRGYVTVKAGKDIIDKVPVLVISIEDSGIGINPDSLNVIFEKFRQADASVSRRYGGTGLGLPISKKLTEFMGGVIKVESEPQKGSVFTLYLPYKESQGGELISPLKVDDIVVQEKTKDRLRNNLHNQKKLLIVEDYEGNIVVLSHLLEEMGFVYDIARTGLEAIECWKRNSYALILMDVQMPEMDGLTATRRIRELEKEQEEDMTPIIGLTAHALVADREKCINAGMNMYLPKPIDEIEFRKVVTKFTEKQPGDKSRAA